MITTLFVNYYVIPSTSFKHEMCIQTDTDRQTDSQTDRQTDRQTDKAYSKKLVPKNGRIQKK